MDNIFDNVGMGYREYIPNDTSVHSRLHSVIHAIMSAFYPDCST